MEIIVGVLGALVVVLVIALAILARRSSTAVDLKQASEQLLTLAEQRLRLAAQAGASDLDTKKQLIDQQVEAVKQELAKVTDLVRGFEKDRDAKFSELSTRIKTLGEQTAGLTSATSTLREALASSRARGQWGERMADDILRFAGFVEGVNYLRQKTLDGTGCRPDYVFRLPNGLSLNMDVKFPLDNYRKALEASNEAERESCEKAFLRDVRNKVKEIAGREYIDPEGGTVDCALMFIPNESIYSYIHQADPTLLDEAIRNRVVCCSPLTLFAVLAVIRQASENFALQKASHEILSHLGRFNVEWKKFTDALKALGDRLVKTQRAYDDLAGTRMRQLERPLARLEALRQQRGIEVAPGSETHLLEAADTEDSSENDSEG